jgi:hypothetical protein
MTLVGAGPDAVPAAGGAVCRTATDRGVVMRPIVSKAATVVTAIGAFVYRGTFRVVERMMVTDGVVQVDFGRGHFHFCAAPSTCP